MSIEEQIRQFLAAKLAQDPARPFTDHDDLFTTGVLDSLNFVTLLQFLNKHLGVKFLPSELLFEHFDTVEKIAAMVRKKQAP